MKKLPSAEWHLSSEQKQKLGSILDSIPDQERFPVNFQALIGSTQSQMYKDDLGIVFDAHHWAVGGGVDTGLRPDLTGLFISVSPEVKTDQDLPPNARRLANILRQADIDFQFGHRDGLSKEVFQLNTGTRPEK